MNIPPVRQAEIAMMWNRIDFGRKIFSREREWNVSLLNRYFLNLI